MIRHSSHDYVEISFVYICVILTILLLSQIAVPVTNSRLGIIVPVVNKSEPIVIYKEEVFKGVTVRAKSYVVYDIVDKKLIASKNAETILPLASITKIMMAITAITQHSKNTKITITPKSLDGGYDLGLKNNQVWKLSELLKYTLVFSSNDGAQEIADGLGGRNLFVAEMNAKAVALGLTTLHFTHPAGLDIGSEIGGVGSALEVAKLFTVAQHLFPEILDATTKNRLNVTASTGRIVGIPNTNQNITDLLGAEASKTGFTDSAGGNLAVIVDVTVGHPVVIVVLGSTHEERFSDTETLYRTLLKSLIK